MGLFSSIKKAVKKVFKGVKKVFKKVAKFAGRVMKSKWGKALMIAAAVWTGGAALGAWGGGAASGATAGQTFLGKFVAGAKDFVGGVFGQGGAAATGGGVAAGVATPGVAGAAGAGAGAAGAGAAPGLFSKIGSAVGGFIKSPGGGALLSNAMQGYAQGKMAEEEREWNSGWGDPDRLAQLGAANERGVNPNTPNLLERSRRAAREQTGAPSVGFNAAPTTGVRSYAAG